MADYQLAQINIARANAAFDSPELAEFMAQVDGTNALAHESPRRIWRLHTDAGDAPATRNVTVAASEGAADYFAQNRPEIKQKVTDYHEYIREKDVTLTHALVNLQRGRTPGAATNLSEEVALTAVKETDAGLVVRGSRVLATLGPISDESAS